MSGAQRAFDRLVQLIRAQPLALLEVELHQRIVHLDHLIDELIVRGGDRTEIGVACWRRKETVDDAAPVIDREVEWQALRAEPVAQGLQGRGGGGPPAPDGGPAT